MGRVFKPTSETSAKCKRLAFYFYARGVPNNSLTVLQRVHVGTFAPTLHVIKHRFASTDAGTAWKLQSHSCGSSPISLWHCRHERYTRGLSMCVLVYSPKWVVKTGHADACCVHDAGAKQPVCTLS